MITRRWILGGLAGSTALALAGVPALAEAPARSLRPVPRGGQAAGLSATSAEALIEAAKLGAAVSAYVVMDAATGTVLEQREAEVPLPPASVTRAAAAIAAALPPSA